MRVASTPSELSDALTPDIFKGLKVGLVPTMGALHKGHEKLILRCISENDISVVSVFVNPAQFNNAEDLKMYPRTLREDIGILEKLKVDYLFNPKEHEMYAETPSLSINFGKMASVLEGEFRPGHFNGVGLIIAKLFNIIRPNKAYFGLKDLQQFLLIKKMTKELNFRAEVIGVDTVRESSGLAMSSRNQRLSTEGKKIASTISEGLHLIQKGLEQEEELQYVLNRALAFYARQKGLEVEYLRAVNPINLKSIKSYSRNSELAVCFSGYVEGIRLIDNLYLRLKA